VPQCSFGDGEVICRVALPRGCIARPDDREQELCWHHLLKSQPIGGIALVEYYTLPGGDRAADLFTESSRGPK
jgi:hypothetical protein